MTQFIASKSIQRAIYVHIKYNTIQYNSQRARNTTPCDVMWCDSIHFFIAYIWIDGNNSDSNDLCIKGRNVRKYMEGWGRKKKQPKVKQIEMPHVLFLDPFLFTLENVHSLKWNTAKSQRINREHSVAFLSNFFFQVNFYIYFFTLHSCSLK